MTLATRVTSSPHHQYEIHVLVIGKIHVHLTENYLRNVIENRKSKQTRSLICRVNQFEALFIVLRYMKVDLGLTGVMVVVLFQFT